MMRGLPKGRALGVAIPIISTVITIAASGCNSDPKGTNGVNDVRAACDLRINWIRSGNDCSVCESGAVTPRCDCSALADFSAACIEQADARKAACPESVEQCVLKCDRVDCGCVEGCYANDANCKSASAARDGCVTETCAPHCK